MAAGPVSGSWSDLWTWRWSQTPSVVDSQLLGLVLEVIGVIHITLCFSFVGLEGSSALMLSVSRGCGRSGGGANHSHGHGQSEVREELPAGHGVFRAAHKGVQ